MSRDSSNTLAFANTMVLWATLGFWAAASFGIMLIVVSLLPMLIGMLTPQSNYRMDEKLAVVLTGCWLAVATIITASIVASIFGSIHYLSKILMGLFLLAHIAEHLNMIKKHERRQRSMFR